MTQRFICYQCQRPIVPGQHYYTASIDCLAPPPPVCVHWACLAAWKRENPSGEPALRLHSKQRT
jgi:hypothetical protein